MVMVLRKANIIFFFGCIKRSILYKVRGGAYSLSPHVRTAMKHLVLGWERGAGRRNLSQRRGPANTSKGTANIRSQSENGLGGLLMAGRGGLKKGLSEGMGDSCYCISAHIQGHRDPQVSVSSGH